MERHGQFRQYAAERIANREVEADTFGLSRALRFLVGYSAGHDSLVKRARERLPGWNGDVVQFSPDGPVGNDRSVMMVICVALRVVCGRRQRNPSARMS